MAITHAHIAPGREDLGRRVLIVARGIAPCIDSLVEDTEEWKDAVAVLKAVVADMPAPGTRGIASQRTGSSSVTYTQISGAFDSTARASLRALCGLEAAEGLPQGSFPPAGLVSRVWPEESPAARWP